MIMSQNENAPDTGRVKDGALPPGKQKYDRQIRIWGEGGQCALERSAVCVINVGPTGTETLKNLVLPGIGSFVIVDSHDVEETDLGNNFFIHRTAGADSSREDTPHGRAAAASLSLLELNENVSGGYIADDPAAFLVDEDAAAAFAQRFSVVIATQIGLGAGVMRVLAAGCLKARVPLIVVRSYGLIGYMRIQIPELCVLDARQDEDRFDLRLDDPFPELSEVIDSFDLDTIADSTVASHIPFVVLLSKAVANYKKAHGGKLPATRAEKDEFAETVKQLRPKACPEDAENFAEALKYSNLRMCYSTASPVSTTLRGILEDEKSKAEVMKEQVLSPPLQASTPLPTPTILNVAKHEDGVEPSDEPGAMNAHASISLASAKQHEDDAASFWLHVAGVRKFVAEHSNPPLPGKLPDMAADTSSYVRLQRTYANKAAADAAEVMRNISAIAADSKASFSYDEQSVKEFCRKLDGVRVLRYRSIADELENVPGSEFADALTMAGAVEPEGANSPIAYYVILRAVDIFYEEHGRYPGDSPGPTSDDSRLLRSCLSRVKTELAVPGGADQWSDECDEVVRYGDVELHNIASYMGGVAAQEAIKILTRQFVPINNTMLVNFASMTSTSFVA